MAELCVDGDELVLRLSDSERFEGVHGDLGAPLSVVRALVGVDDAHERTDHGLKVGTRLRGVIEVGKVLRGSERVFAVVHPNTPGGVRADVDGANWDAWIVGCADPEGVKARIDRR